LALIASARVLAQTAQIAITEIMYNPPESGNDSLEYIELYNYGSVPVNLEGYSFTGVAYVIPAEVMGFPPVMPAGEYTVVAINHVALMNTFGLGFATSWTSGALSNNGEGLSLRDAQGNLVDTVFYDNTSAWPAVADGGGASLERCDHTSDGTLPESWIASTTSTGVFVNEIEVFGTPGAANSTCITVGLDDNIVSTLTAIPNPSADGIFTLSAPVSGTVSDMMGRVVATITEGRSIDISAERTGHYVLRTEEGQVIRLMK